jgi:hypothetical protein
VSKVKCEGAVGVFSGLALVEVGLLGDIDDEADVEADVEVEVLLFSSLR